MDGGTTLHRWSAATDSWRACAARAALALVLGASAGCNRYEYVRPDCPPLPPSRSAIAWRYVTGAPGTVKVTVTFIDSLHPIFDAGVRLQPDSGAAINFAPPYARSNITPGYYTLDVFRIGFSRASERVQVGPDSAVEAVAVLSPHHLTLDGCGYVLVRERKPWWKWW